MRTSSERVRDYCRDLPTAAPDYLREWAEKRPWRKNILLFKQGWVTEPITGMKSKAAECICTACGKKFYEGWIGAGCHNGRIGVRIGTQAYAEWMEAICPECGAKVDVRHLNGGDKYGDEFVFPLTFLRIPEPGKADRLALIEWSVEKCFDKEGRRHITIKAFEAYIAEERDAKLELYLRNGHTVFPAAWIKIWQRHPAAETLLTCGAGDIIGNMIGQEKQERTSYRYTYNTKIPKLTALNWKARRPWEILRMKGKDELRAAIALQQEKNLGGRTWRMWLQGRAEGKPWTLEDAEALEALKTPERITATEIRPSKALRYLNAQRRRWPEDRADEIMLTDYWTMAAEGFDMNDQALLWPDRLKREHDRLTVKRAKETNAKQDEKIETQARKLDQLAFCLNGITIRPARSTAELVAEGQCLRHCVGSYAERVAKGETFIFFIRREAEPDLSWYTLNLDKSMKTVIQNRGMRNCDRTPEVMAFEDAWIAWVRAGAKRDKNGNPTINQNNKESAA